MSLRFVWSRVSVFLYSLGPLSWFCTILLNFLLLFFQTALIHVMIDVVHPPYSWFSCCPGASHFNLHPRLLHSFCSIHPQNVCMSVQPGLPRFQCDFFQVLPNLIVLMLVVFYVENKHHCIAYSSGLRTYHGLHSHYGP